MPAAQHCSMKKQLLYLFPISRCSSCKHHGFLNLTLSFAALTEAGDAGYCQGEARHTNLVLKANL